MMNIETLSVVDAFRIQKEEKMMNIETLSVADAFRIQKELSARCEKEREKYEKLHWENAFHLLELNLFNDGKVIKKIIRKVIAHALAIHAIAKDDRKFCDSNNKRNCHDLPCWYIEEYAYGSDEDSENISCAMHTASDLLKYGHDGKYLVPGGIVFPGDTCKAYQNIAKKIMSTVGRNDL